MTGIGLLQSHDGESMLESNESKRRANVNCEGEGWEVKTIVSLIPPCSC